MLKTAPAVFAVADTYQIMVETKQEALFWVRIGDEEYFDESNGIMNSLTDIHRVKVPMNVLNEAGMYTVCVRPIIERKPYFTQTAAVWEKTYAFRPVPKENIRIYHISDAHNRVSLPVQAARAFGEIDLLVLNGDVIDHSGDPSKFSNVYEICSILTGGALPVVFSRGNHDMRGRYAERFADYTPNHLGNTYYTFRLGSLWGLLVDCGEDKPDSNEEYGNTVACHVFRKRQTKFLYEMIRNAENEYAAESVKKRIVIAHKPFTQRDVHPFDIEEEIFTEWCTLLREHVHPDLMLCGHTHQIEIRLPGHERDHYGQACPVVIGAQPEEELFVGCGFVLHENTADVVFTDSEGEVLSKETIQYGLHNTEQ